MALFLALCSLGQKRYWHQCSSDFTTITVPELLRPMVNNLTYAFFMHSLYICKYSLYFQEFDHCFSNFSGDPIPRVEYTPEEVATWREVYNRVDELLPGRACTLHRKALENMMRECGFGPDNIPQMEDLSNYLKST